VSSPTCPRCGRSQARRTSRSGPGERFLSVFYAYPFRCQVCGRRFRAVQWGVRYARMTDVREFDRIPIRVVAVVDDGRTNFQGETINLSVDGCAVETDAALLPDASVRIQLQLPHDERPVDVALAVVRASRQGAIGLHFVRMDADSRQRLRRFMLSLHGDHGEPNPERWAGALRYPFSLDLWLAGLVAVIMFIVLFYFGTQFFSTCIWGVNC
jgi:PilZ domain